jgi:ABC-2 type transport system ATP-binding protein
MIEVNNLVKRYNGFTAVDAISFTVEKGDIFAFLGPNGAGKTTTIKMLTTLSHPTSGSMRLNGFDPVVNQDDVRKSFGIVFQDPSLDDELTAWENLEFHGVLYNVSGDLRKKRIQELLELVELWDKRDALVKTYSGGMKRRLEIARGLLHHPKIFFLDEPTIGLDPQTRNKMWKYILDLNRREGITIFFTTHYIEEADKMAHNVAIIDHGRIVSLGTPEGIKQKAKSKTLEEAFLSLTGHEIREEETTGIDHMRQRRQMWRR